LDPDADDDDDDEGQLDFGLCRAKPTGYCKNEGSWREWSHDLSQPIDSMGGERILSKSEL